MVTMPPVLWMDGLTSPRRTCSCMPCSQSPLQSRKMMPMDTHRLLEPSVQLELIHVPSFECFHGAGPGTLQPTSVRTDRQVDQA
eukprot:3391820-Amphidinium_carterae.2